MTLIKNTRTKQILNGVVKTMCLSLPFLAAELLSSSASFAQVSDTRPPKLASLDLSPPMVEVSAGAQPIVVSMNVMDDLAGVSSVEITVTSPSGRQEQCALLPLIGGDPLNGIWQGAVSIPQYSEAGLWQIKSVTVRDGVGNVALSNSSTLANMGFPTNFTVVSRPEDIEPPRLTRIDLTPTSSPSPLDVSMKAQNMTITMDLADNLSGVDLKTDRTSWFLMELSSPVTSRKRLLTNHDFTLISGTPQNGTWQAKLNMPRFSERGKWYVSSLSISDHVNNTLLLNKADLIAMGLPANFQVRSDSPDTLPPQLLSLTISPPLLDTATGPGQVVITIGVSDDLSGVSFSPDSPFISVFRGVSFTSPSGAQVQSAGTFPPARLISGNPRNGTWQTTVNFPQFSEAGIWKAKVFLQDVTNHEVVVDAAEIRAKGFSADLVITKPSLAVDGTVTDPSAGGSVEDEIFGARAEVHFPPKALNASTDVSIDVLQKPFEHQGTLDPATYFVRFGLSPPPGDRFKSPGLTLVLPLIKALAPGVDVQLFQFDRATGNLVPAIGADGRPVIGTADASGLSASFSGVVRLPLLVGLIRSNR